MKRHQAVSVSSIVSIIMSELSAVINTRCNYGLLLCHVNSIGWWYWTWYFEDNSQSICYVLIILCYVL